MLRHRRILLIVCCLMVVGSISATLAYAYRLRSSGYRELVQARLSDKLRMRVSLGSIEPLSLRARRFHDVRLRLPRRDVEVFRCGQAVWHDESTSGAPGFSLDLRDGWMLAGTDEWDRDDYRAMLLGGLGHDFAALGIKRITLDDIDLQWSHPRFALMSEGCSGDIVFRGDGTARATLAADRLNGAPVDEPISIVADLTPGQAPQFHHVVLKLPEIPIAALKLDALVGGAVTRGSFTGQLAFRQRGTSWSVGIDGRVRNAELRELSAALPGGPYDGGLDIQVDEATIDQSGLRDLRFSGRLDGLSVGQLVPMFGLPPQAGTVALRVHQAAYQSGRITYLSAEGSAGGLSLTDLSTLIGRGKITGTADVTIESMMVVDDRLTLAAVTIAATPPAGAAGTIDRVMLQNASQRLLGFDVTPMLPESTEFIEYEKLGVRLDLNGGALRVHGTHGDDGRTILTVNLFGRPLGVIKEPKRSFDVSGYLDAMTRRVGTYDADQLREWWRAREAGGDEGM
ncbi:MAG: hypothetical protein HOP29_13805 [Phycisphaerales bacterium]|nr:hypothetical protein [Phycisphaerales bacterium]